MFESVIEQHIMHPRLGWPLIPMERHRCTMAAALAQALPAKLETVAKALELERQKDVAGHRLMLQMSKPRKPRKGEDPNSVYWFEDPDRLQRLYEYCEDDTKSERELHACVPPLSPEEQTLWLLDQKINSRGFYADRSLAEAARKIAKAAAPEIDAELSELTHGAVTGVNQIAKLQAWLEQHCCFTSSLDKKAVTKLLNTELSPPARRALELRQDGGQAAVKKMDALLRCIGSDGRVRGTLQFHKASTGRWAGTLYQPQNLKRIEAEDAAAIAAVMTGDYAHVAGLYPRVLSVLGDLGRSLICAAPGYQLIGADFSAIESRVLAWVADEQWKLDAYRRADATGDPRDEVYAILACRMLRVPKGTITKKNMPRERTMGKTGDLACGYQGGETAIEAFAPGVFSDEEKTRIKLEWRAAHPRTCKFWHAIDHAAWEAVNHRGRIVRCGPVAFKSNGNVLFLKLPSGRKLAYSFAWNRRTDDSHGVVMFMDNAKGLWRECNYGKGAYGGIWTENIVSGIARDLLASAMLRLEAAGYPIVLTVHDEVVCEVSEGFGSTEEFAHIMTRVPAWAPTLPIAAEAWTGPRFS
jgi:DNA polymerase bacteriophage-type